MNILVVILILLALGAFWGGLGGWWPHTYGIGGGTILLIILLVLLLR